MQLESSDLARIRRLSLFGFRNHFESIFSIADSSLIVLRGKNGAGKTSVLESIYLLGTGRGIRRRRDGEFVRFGSDKYRINAVMERCEESKVVSSRDLEIRYVAEGKSRIAFVDGEKISSWGDFIGLLPVALLRPDDIDLVEGGPEHRRRLMDVMLCQVSANYFSSLRRYRRARKQRMKSAGAAGFRVRKSFGQEMIEAMPLICAEREGSVARLSEMCRPLMKALGIYGVLELEYRPALPSECRDEWRSNKDWTKMAEISLREEDRLLNHGSPSPFGPARDEIIVRLDGIDLRKFGSQGQKRIVSIVLRMAEAALMKGFGRSPVLLIDDVMGELDDSRREALCDLIKASKYQTWIATASASGLSEHWPDGQIFDINNGKIQGV